MASANTRRILFWSIAAALLAVAMVAAFRPRPVPVDLATVVSEPLQVTVTEEARTRVRDIYVVSAPVAGRARRSGLEVGDPVEANVTVVAEIEPADPAFLDQRARSEAEAEVAAAAAALALARAEVEEADAELDFARSELERARRLETTGTISAQAADDALRAFRTRTAALATARERVRVQEHSLNRARSRLTSPVTAGAGAHECECFVLKSPVTGQVLQIHHESAGVVASGEPLVSVGDARDLEIVAEMLSSDAVRVREGMRVVIDGWGQDAVLDGVVERVEPFGFTKVSALGIEEQRVNVLVALRGERAERATLGHGFRVDVHVVTSELASARIVPLTALFRHGDGWAVFLDDGGSARLQTVTIAARAGLRVAVDDGLEPGQRVIVSPGDRIRDGVLITDRRD